MVSLNPQMLANCLNSLLLYGMLSKTSSSRIPCPVKIDFMSVTMVPAGFVTHEAHFDELGVELSMAFLCSKTSQIEAFATSDLVWHEESSVRSDFCLCVSGRLCTLQQSYGCHVTFQANKQ